METFLTFLFIISWLTLLSAFIILTIDLNKRVKDLSYKLTIMHEDIIQVILKLERTFPVKR